MKRDIVSAYVHSRRDIPLPLYAPVHILDDTPPSPLSQLSTNVMNGLNQKTNNIWVSYSLKYQYPKKKILYEKINGNVVEINIQGSSINQKPNSIMSVMLCTKASFAKKNSWLVTRIVSYVCIYLLSVF